MGKLKTYQQQLQSIVDKGINTAEEQQKKISAKPFSFAEKIESDLRAYSVATLRQRYYGYSDEVFDQLRNLNSRFSNFAGDLVAKIEKEAVEGKEAISDAAERAVETAESAVDEVTKTAKKASSKVSEVTDDVAEEVSEAAEDLASDVSDAVEGAEKSVESDKRVARKSTSGATKSTTSA